jgi:hypothetical protein
MEVIYTNKHNDLMERWMTKIFHQDKKFIKDGIIDILRWQDADRKIMLLLKEAYGDYGDLCSLIKDEWKGPKYKMWWTASYWLYALTKSSKNYIPPFPREQKQFEECIKYLLSSAVVNIKKSGGETSSNHEDLLKYVREDGNLLKEQISLINPGIIICGYTFDYLKEIWSGNITPVGDSNRIFTTSENHIIIDWWHPANQYPDDLCYYALCAIIQESNILNLKNKKY